MHGISSQWQPRRSQQQATSPSTLTNQPRPRTAINTEGNTMYQVILKAEDGEYTLTDPMSEAAAIRWIKRNESRYGEGQRLCLQFVQGW
jgi:hypothetical protein